MNKIEKTNMVINALKNVKKEMEDRGYNVAYLCVQGSTNYNLDIYNDNYQSDIDMKCFVIPSFDNLYRNKEISTVYHTEYGLVEVKDVRHLVDLLKKMNLTYLELLATKYYLTDYPVFNDIRKLLDSLFEDRKYILLNSIVGTMNSKMTEFSHITEATKPLFDKFGYNSKALHHLKRLEFMLDRLFKKDYLLSNAYEFDGPERDYLIRLKEFGAGDINTVRSSAINTFESARLFAVRTVENARLDGIYEIKD